MQKRNHLFLKQNLGNMVRIPEDNTWVIFILLACIFALIFMMNTIQRDATLKDFLLQKYYDSANNFISWLIISMVTATCLATLFSQFIPTTPEILAKLSVFGIQLNKFGFTFFAILLFYFLKSGLSFLLYQSTGNSKKWPLLYFTASKFYFLLCFVLIIANIINYYFPIERSIAFNYYLYTLSFIFIFKILFYFFHTNNILPEKWYYKILYICTLQIAPLLIIWRLLFF